MPSIEPLGTEAPDLEPVRPTLESFARLGDEAATFPRILGRVPKYAETLWDAMETSLFEGGVDHRLKEIMRVQLAATARDPYFSTLRSKPAQEAGLTEERLAAGQGEFENDPQFTDAEKWALRYSHLMYREPDKVDAAFYEEGKQHFTEAQIMELGGLIAVHYGMAVFMSTLSDS